jgi:type IV secretion system protein VirB4
MLNLAEYRPRCDRLADYLPWAFVIAPGVILNKDGSFQRSFGFRGPDLESATEAELVAACARLNNVLRRFGSGWALFFEAERFAAAFYPQSRFPDAASALIDRERRAAFSASAASPEREHFETAYTLTLLFLPPVDPARRAELALVRRPGAGQGRDWRQELDAFIARSDEVFDLLYAILPEIEALDDGRTLSYLHRTISPQRHDLVVPETPLYLDAVLVDTPLSGGIEPMLGDEHLRVLTLLGFPNRSRPGLLDGLNHLGFGYRWMSRFLPLNKSDANKVLLRLRRQWFNKRKSVAALLREVLHNEPSVLIDSDADNKLVDADLALQELGADQVSFGYLTTTIVVTDKDPGTARDKLRAIEQVVHGAGFTAIRESLNAVDAWLGSLPGHVYANVRQPLVHSLNLAHLVPFSALWAGPQGDAHLHGPPLFVAETSGFTPFRFSTHVGDVGHLLIVGPTGAGKSVLLALMALQFRRYDGSQVYIFDKGNSARAAVLAAGGRHHRLGDEDGLSFQPLRHIDRAAELSWAFAWLGALLEQERVRLDPELKERLWSALCSLASAPAEERTLTGLAVLVQSQLLKDGLMPYTLEGPYGRLLDGAEDRLALADLQCFETEALMAEEGAVKPVLSYIFHRLEARFVDRPSLLILDEAWLFLDNPLFAARIREWLKVLRKKNVAVVFATQSLADIQASQIAPAIIESCPQRIFLPNDRAQEPQARSAYEGFGLNGRQIALIAHAVPKRQYYLQSRRGNRMFELALGPLAQTLCGASDGLSQKLIDRLLSEAGDTDFAARFLAAKGLDWAAALIANWEAL